MNTLYFFENFRLAVMPVFVTIFILYIPEANVDTGTEAKLLRLLTETFSIISLPIASVIVAFVTCVLAGNQIYNASVAIAGIIFISVAVLLLSKDTDLL